MTTPTNMTTRSSSKDRNGIEILLRLAQSLLNVIKSQQKGATDIGPYVKRYNFLRQETITLLGDDSQNFLPESPKKEGLPFVFGRLMEKKR